MRNLALLFLAVVASSVVDSQDDVSSSTIPTPTKCPPKPESIKDLDIERYTGTWFQIRSLPSFFQPPGTKCIKATYEQTGNDSIIIWNTHTRPDGGFGELCGSADTIDPENPGEFLVKFNFSPTGGSNMQILATDYDNYAAVYSCVDFPVVGKFEYAWVLTRNPFPTAAIVSAGRDALAAKGIEVDRLETIEQSPDCIYEKLDGISCFDEAKKANEEKLRLEAASSDVTEDKTEAPTS